MTPDRSHDPLRTVDHVPAVDSVNANSTVDDARTTPHLPAALPDAPDIAGYRITELIAKGGMGQVYGGQDLTLDREVAIKTLLPGANAERFITEAKITARLPHPNIPPVHALGTLHDGTPWLAMKRIRGRTLAELLKERASQRHDISRYVQVFEQIAQAVGFAHSRGILHRDLKPLNVMVGEFGEVQVMDWGLAKDVTGRDPEAPSETSAAEGDHTRVGTILGTPGYMAPEQARGEVVDARADVFALGSILAAILTGKPAIVGKETREIIDRTAREELAEVYGRLEGCGADAELIALAKRCLAAKAETRPADGRVVAAEVAAYRAGVEARLRQAETERAEAAVRVAETRKRQRTLLAAGGIIAAVLVAGIIGTGLGLFQANQAAENERKAKIFAQGETQRAEQNATKEREARTLADAAAENERKARKQADEEKAVAVTVRDFLQTRFIRPANPFEGSRVRQLLYKDKRQIRVGEPEAPIRDLTVRELLEQAATDFAPETIASKFPDQPAVQAEILETIAETYEGLNEYEKSVRYMVAANRLRVQHLGPTHPVSLTSKVNLIFINLAASKIGDTFKDMNDISIIVEQLVKEVPVNPTAQQGHPAVEKLDVVLNRIIERANPDSFAYAQTKVSVAEGALLAIQLPGLLSRISRLTQEFRKRFGAEDARTIAIDLWLAFGKDAMGQTKQAIEQYEELVARAERVLKPESRLLDGLREVLIASYTKLEIHQDRSIAMMEKMFESKRKRLSLDHPTVLNHMHNLANLYEKSGKLENSIRLHKEAIQLTKVKFGPDHPKTIDCMHNLAGVYQDNKQLDLAIPLYEETLQLSKVNLGPDHSDTLSTMNNLGVAYHQVSRYADSIKLHEEAKKILETKLGLEHSETLLATYNLGVAYRSANRFQEAIPLLDQVWQRREKLLGLEDPKTLEALNELTYTFEDMGKHSEVIKLWSRIHQLQETKHGPDHPQTLIALNNLAQGYRNSRQFGESLKLYEKLYKHQLSKFESDHLDTLNSLNNIAYIYRETGRRDQAIQLYKKVLAAYEAKAGPEHSATLNTMSGLAYTYRSLNQLEEAKQLYEKVYKARVNTLGLEHVDTLNTATMLGDLNRKLGLFEQAIHYHGQAAKGRESKLGLEHKQTLDSLGYLGQVYCYAKQGEKALPHFEKMIAVYRKRFTKEDPGFALVLATVSADLIRGDQFVVAEKMLREALALCEKSLPNAWETFLIQGMLGQAMLGQKKYMETEPLLLKGYEGMRKQYFPPFASSRATIDICLTLDALIALYEAIDKPDAVKKYRDLRAKYPASPAGK
jgi:tetratricopeptide (TPR) repeat protein